MPATAAHTVYLFCPIGNAAKCARTIGQRAKEGANNTTLRRLPLAHWATRILMTENPRLPQLLDLDNQNPSDVARPRHLPFEEDQRASERSPVVSRWAEIRVLISSTAKGVRIDSRSKGIKNTLSPAGSVYPRGPSLELPSSANRFREDYQSHPDRSSAATLPSSIQTPRPSLSLGLAKSRLT